MVGWLLLLFGLAVGYAPLLLVFAGNLWERPHYQHFPFVILAAGVLMWRTVAECEPRAGGERGWWMAPLAGVAWLLLVVAYLAPSPLLAAGSAILTTAAVVGWFTTSQGLRFPLGAWTLLWLTLPIPLDGDKQLITNLQHLSSVQASQALDLIGVDHLMDGNTLVLPDRELFVAEACSGIVSVISIATCAAMYGVWRRRGLTHTLLLIALGAGWATLMNVVRIVAIALADVYGGVDLAADPAHTCLGLAVFGVAAGAIILTDWLLNALLAGVRERWQNQTGEPLRFGAMLVDAWDWVVSLGRREPSGSPATHALASLRRQAARGVGTVGIVAALAFASIGGWGLSRWEFAEITGVLANDPYDGQSLVEILQAIEDPFQVEGLELVETELRKRPDGDPFGEFSVTYKLKDENDRRFFVSCDFPYTDPWHLLARCYRGIGWRVEGRQIIAQTPASDGAAESGAYETVVLDLTRPDGVEALVQYCAWSERGVAAEAPRQGLVDRLASVLRRRRLASEYTLQAQVLVQRADGVSERDRRIASELLAAARGVFVPATIANN